MKALRMVAPARAERLEQADLAGALGHGDQHHVHHQDAGHRQADRGDAGHRRGQRAQQLVEGGEHGILGDHRDVFLAAVAGLEQRRSLRA
jgi:hypothetical protein